MALPAQAILAVGVDDGMRGGKLFVHLMVVHDHNVDAAFCRNFKRFETGRSAVHRDDQARAVIDERGNGFGVRPIAFGDAVGDVDARLQPVAGQEAVKQRRRGGAIDVIVAENRDALACGDGARQPLRRLVHIGQRRWIGAQRADRRIEHIRHLVERNVARGQQAADDFREIVALSDGRAEVGLRGGKPLHPLEPARGALDAKERRIFSRRLLQGQG